MPIDKPTIAHQLKTVKQNKPKSSAVIHTQPNILISAPHTRSHLRNNCVQWKKNSYDRGEHMAGIADITQSELQKCTRILRNVLANEGLNQTLMLDRKDKSTSTDVCDFEQKIINSKAVGFTTPELSNIGGRLSSQELADKADDITEADSIISVGEQNTPVTDNLTFSQGSNPINICPSLPFCTCKADINNTSPMHESKRSVGPTDYNRGSNAKLSLCSRCHNVIPPTNYLDKDINAKKISDLNCGHDQNSKPYPPYTPSTASEFKVPIRYDHFGDENIDNLAGLLQGKVNEIGMIARTTRDADLDRLVYEIDRIFQQMVRENALLFNHLKTITKTLKLDNSALKQKVKGQSETNRDLKSEIKLLRQENKKNIEELKLEIQVKGEEIRQLTDRDKNGIILWRDKYQSLEKEHEKMRCEYQGQVLQSCQKDTEVIHLRHICSQTESKLKEEIHTLKLNNQNLQSELSKTQDTVKRYDQECHHNQSIIKAAREHVVQLLDRHREGRNESTTTLSNYRFEPLSETSVSGTGDWIYQATSLQKVLSMVSDRKSVVNDLPSHSKYPYDQSRSMTISPINFGTTNCNNNYISSSTCNGNDLESSKKHIDDLLDPSKYSHEPPGSRDMSRSPSDISSTLSHISFGSSTRKTKDNNNGCSIDGKNSKLNQRSRDYDGDVGSHNDPWIFNLPKAKMSSTSSLMSTVSSLRSTDDREFRTGLQKLDSQISRLQTTLQSKLVSK